MSLVVDIDLLSSPSSSSFSSKSSEELDVTVNARRLFNSCLDEETIDREDDQLFLSLINSQLGGWPILKSSSWNETTFNLSDVLLRLHQHGSSMLFASDTYISPTNSSTVSIIVRSPNRKDDEEENDANHLAWSKWSGSAGSQLLSRWNRNHSSISHLYQRLRSGIQQRHTRRSIRGHGDLSVRKENC